MNVELFDRLEEHVVNFWIATKDEEIKKLFPFSNSTLNEALCLFEETKKIGSSSFGKVIYVDGNYIGDIWIYGIDEMLEKMAMISIVIFDKKYWNKGIGTSAIEKFKIICFDTYDIDKIGAFTYSSNIGSLRGLKKSGFKVINFFVEDGAESVYLECTK